MKKTTAFLFIPLFLIFGYMHEYKFPHFSMPRNSSAPSGFDIYSTHDPIGTAGTANSGSSVNSNTSASVNNPISSAYPSQTQTSPVTDSNATSNNTFQTPGVPNTGPAVTQMPQNTESTSSPTSTFTPISIPIPLPTTLGNVTGDASATNPLPPPVPSTLGDVSTDTTTITPTQIIPPVSPPTTSPDAPATSNATSTGDQTSSSTQPTLPPPMTDESSSTPVATTSPSTITTPPQSTFPSNDTNNNAGNIFSTGAVTFRFDDGWQSQFDVALPALQAAGFKGTFYIITKQLSDQGFSGFMSSAEVQQLAADGEEVGDHTQTHPHLPTLSTDQQQAEIVGAQQDLQALNINPQTFSYPYGEYTTDTTQIVKNAGFTSAATTIETAVTPTSDPFQLESPSLQVTDTPAQVEQMIQNAVDNHQWLIMTFHRIDTSGDQYSMTPENFQQVVQYVAAHDIPVVTVSEGAAQLSH